MNLAVATFLDEEDKARTIVSEGKHIAKATKKQKALKEIESLLDTIQAMGRMVLAALITEDQRFKSVGNFLTCYTLPLICHSDQGDIMLSLTLLGYSRYLRRVTANESFDFSALQAICRWITDAVEDCPPAFIQLATQARILSETVSLSSGLGLIEIWSSVFIDKSQTSSTSALEDIEARTLDLKGNKAPGEFGIFSRAGLS